MVNRLDVQVVDGYHRSALFEINNGKLTAHVDNMSVTLRVAQVVMMGAQGRLTVNAFNRDNDAITIMVLNGEYNAIVDFFESHDITVLDAS